MAALALLRPTRLGFHLAPSESESRAMAAHFAYLSGLVARGEVITAGPVEDGSLGLVVFARASAEAATQLMRADPAVTAGVMSVEVKPWRMSLFGTGTERDWTGFVQAIHIAAEPTRVFELISTCAGLERWFLLRAEAADAAGGTAPRQQTLPVGGRLAMSWPSLSAASVTEPNDILACEQPSRLRLGWFQGKGWVEFRVAPREGGGSTVELEQRMHASNDRALLEQAYIGCTEGWAFYLTNLKSMAETGHDLREKRVDRTGLINV